MGDKWDALADTMVGGYQEQFVADLSWRFVGMLERGVSNPDMLSVLARQSRTEAMRVWAEWSDRVSEETARAFAEALEEADGEMVSSASRAGIPPRFDATPWAVNRVNEAARGMAEIVRRQNVALADSLADAWYDVTAEAVTYIQGGASLDRVMERAVSMLAAEGLQTIDYKSGVRTSIDAAVRRHAVTQSNQCRNDLLDKRCDQYGLDLVMVSAHFGARPSHALWQGGIYSRSGTSSEYRGLVEATGYGSVSGLCGANCRHTMTPYVEGYSRPQSTDFSRQEALTGKTSDEYYEATQKQRSIERKIRAAKREAAMLEYAGLDNTAQRVQIGRQQARLRQFVADNHLVRDYRREKAYGIPGPDSKTYAGPYARPYTRTTQQPRALSKAKEKVKVSGAINGALNDKNDPDGTKRENHDVQYYAQVRARNKELEVEAIAEHGKVSKEHARVVLEHVFFDEHDLYDGRRRFDESYDMSQSWQRLRSGNGVLPHDIVMLWHEYTEAMLMRSGVGYQQAHDTANQSFNYWEELIKWREGK